MSDGADARVAPLSLRPEMATLTTGSINFGSEVFLNPAPLIDRLYSEMRARGTLPEFEIFDAAMISNARAVYETHEGDHHRHYDLVLGVPGALPWTAEVIPFLVGMLPHDATWSATGIGRAHLPVTEEAIARGGHVRTGFEDVRYYEPGRVAVSNAELVERVAGMAERAGRKIAEPNETREILGLGGTLSS